MPSSTVDVSVDVTRHLFIDKWGISTLPEFTTIAYVHFKNKSPQPVYAKAIINDSSGNWTFEDKSTIKEIGMLDGLCDTEKHLKLNRAVPSSDIEGETFTIAFEIYKDDKYTQKIGEVTKTITAYIVDFKSNKNWSIIENANFDDGTPQGWSLNGFKITDDASLTANGYSAFYYLSEYGKTAHPSLSKTINLPNNKIIGLLFYWGTHVFCDVSEFYARVNYVRVYVNGKKVYEDYANVFADSNKWIHRREGWYQVSVDLTPYAGRKATIEIEFEVYTSEGVDTWVRVAVDNIMIVAK